MIFGAGINQLELIKEAKKLDLTTIVVDPSANPPGKAEAEFYYQVEGKDYDTTKTIAFKHKVDGIVTGQMEKPMRLMARLSKEMGYVFHSPEVVETSLDKWLMKQAFLMHGVPCAKGKLYGEKEHVTRESLVDFSYPLILKPKDAFSSRGVYKIDKFEDIGIRLSETRSFASCGEVIVEEFLQGKEYSVETITFKGETTVIQVTEKFITPFPNTVEMGHLQPAIINEQQKYEVESIVKSAIRAIGIDYSASHAEVMITAGGVKMIEIGARLGGDFIASYLTRASTGISMDKAAVQVALGMAPDVERMKSRYSFIKYIELPLNKKVIEILPVDDITKHPGVVFAWFFLVPGDSTKPITHSALRPACILVEDDSREKVLAMAESFAETIKQRVILK